MLSLSGDNQHKSRESSPQGKTKSNEETRAQVDSGGAVLAASGEVDDLYILEIVHKILLHSTNPFPTNSATFPTSSNFKKNTLSTEVQYTFITFSWYVVGNT